MGTWHIDPDCETAVIRLNDALCSFERATSREYTFILIPHSSDEEIIMSQNGKPLPRDFDMSPHEISGIAINERK